MDTKLLDQIKRKLDEKTTDELVDIWKENDRYEWSAEAFEAIRLILVERGEEVPNQGEGKCFADNIDYRPDIGLPFFSVSTMKLAIMSISTFGFYELYWFYKNWKFLNTKHHFPVYPLGRAWFPPFYCHALFAIIKKYSIHNGCPTESRPGLTAFFYIVLLLTQFLPFPFKFITIFSFYPLTLVQFEIQQIQEKLAPCNNNANGFTKWDVVAILVGLVAWRSLLLHLSAN